MKISITTSERVLDVSVSESERSDIIYPGDRKTYHKLTIYNTGKTIYINPEQIIAVEEIE